MSEERTDLFLVTRDEGLRHVRIERGRRALADAVRALREKVQRPRPAERPALDRAAAELYDVLLGPVEEALARAERVVVLPDGPLQTLPFGVLRHAGHHLVERKPLHSALSATVYAELRKERSASASSMPLLAFGDPRYPAVASRDVVGDGAVRQGLRSGLRLIALPESRREVAAIGRLYPASRVYVGDEATEERVKAEARQARQVHFACHGFVDERQPLNSGLALTTREHPVEGQDNGLLQAWEVFERVRLDADLVTLSACDSGLGKEMGGEGLVGLTRAFQYAGARSVVASLWAVPDYSTTELMRTFYTGLRAGLPKDEALRRAQTALIKGRSQPLEWAAFQLYGDWK